MAPRPRLPLVGAPFLLLVAVVFAQLGAMSTCAGEARRLHGYVACLDCDAGHDLSGVVVAVKCGAGDDGTALHAAQTDGRGAFDIAMPASGSPCAARVLGATKRLCTPPELTVARVVPGRAPAGSTSYTLGSCLAFFTRCGPGGGDGGATEATTMAARDQGRAAPQVPSPRPRTPVRSPPPAGGSGSPYGMGGLPLIYFFPFIPIIGIP